MELKLRIGNEKEILENIDTEIPETYDPDHLIPFLLIDGEFMQYGTGINLELLGKLNDGKIR